jgi:glycosyltransferase involved in cell wall biosynthesis
MRRTLTVRGPHRGPSGHDHHVREFVRALHDRGVAIQLVDVPEWSAVALPAEAQEPWFQALARPLRTPASVQFCMPHQVRPIDGTLTVNYTMFEATRIPAAWVSHGRAHELVVVPTASSRQAWIDSGYPAARVALCPLGIDVARFRPGVEPLDLLDRRGRRVADYRTRVLNVSELGPRKNLLALVRVWIRATTADDDAVLVVKLGRYAPGWTVRFMRDLDAQERALGRSRKDAAPVLFVDRLFPDAGMPSLFASATHYWSMSHGEGWDQPMVEAGATGLRLIAPDHSAYAAYLDETVATLIPSRLVPARFDGDPALARLFRGAEWWEPDEDAAAAALRRALDGDDAPAASIRARLAAQFTWEHASARLLEILDELLASRGLTW